MVIPTIVALLVLLVIWFALPEYGPKVITAFVYCAAAVWLVYQLFGKIKV